MSETWILGRRYSESRAEERRRHAQTLFRFTYRKGFAPMTPYNYRDDSGWGCMLRVVQMLMGQALQRHMLGENWRLPVKIAERRENKDYCNILRWFIDNPGPSCIYALHHLVQCGMAYDKLPGEWYGPTTASLVLRDLAKLHRRRYSGPLEIYVTSGSTVYENEVEEMFFGKAISFERRSETQRLRSTSLELCEDFMHPDSSLDLDVSSGHLRPHNNDSNLNADPTTPVPHLRPSLDHGNDPGTGDGYGDEGLDNNTKKERITEENDQLLDSKDSAKLASVKSKSLRAHHSLHDPLLHPPEVVVQEWPSGLVVIIPVLLGIGSVNPEYYEEIKQVLRHPNSIGIIGGRVNHAIYFAGYRQNTLLGLDPHTTLPTPSLDSPFPSDTYMDEVHGNYLQELSFSQLDPSLGIAFYFSCRNDFSAFCESTKEAVKKKLSEGITPLYSVQFSAPSIQGFDNWGSDNENLKDDSALGDEAGSEDEDDDYVLVNAL